MEAKERKSRVAWPSAAMVYPGLDEETQKAIKKLIDDFGIILEDEAESKKISIFDFPIYKTFSMLAGITETHVLVVIAPPFGTPEQRWVDFQSQQAIPTPEQLMESARQQLGWSPVANLYFDRKFLNQDIAVTSPELSLLAKKWIEQLVEHVEKQARIVRINPIFQRRDFLLEDDLCFVLMPFAQPFSRLYQQHIKPTLEDLNLRVMRADDLFKPAAIIEDIWEYINRARIIVADVTGRNPNVFYELGIAHTVGKDTIILTQNKDDIPFDVSHIRYFEYTDNSGGLKKLQGNLKSAAKATLGIRYGEK